MAREDYSNRTRETLHRNWMFDDTDVLLTGHNGNLRDTFIYNQSWWTKDSKCHIYYYKLQSGVTSGHSHAYPKDREEVVLGLMNRLRKPMERGKNHSSYGGNPWGYMCNDSKVGDNCNNGCGENQEVWCSPKPTGPQGMGIPINCFESSPTMFELVDPWRHYAGDVNNDGCRNSEYSPQNINRADGQDGNNPHRKYKPDAINFEDITIYNFCIHQPSTAGPPSWTCRDGVGGLGDAGQLISKNWMKNQPPSKERTPFRPIYVSDLRQDENPAVPEGGFVTNAKLILTVSQQSIAWPRQGFNVELYPMGSNVTEDANWWHPTASLGLICLPNYLSHDGAGNTLGGWYDKFFRTNQPWNTDFHFLPDPIHKSIFPKERSLWTWGARPLVEGYDPSGPVPQNLCKYTDCEEAEDPHFVACKNSGKETLGSGTNVVPEDQGGYYNEQLLVSPAYDGETSFISNYGDDCTNPIWAPEPWNLSVDDYGIAYPWKGNGCSAGTWHSRASEVEGLTGCGGYVDVTSAGFTYDIQWGQQWYTLDGQRHTTSPNTLSPVPEWMPIAEPNFERFHIPKFTNAGYTGSYDNLTTVPNSGNFNYATGGSGSYDGRGITFSIDVGRFARKAISTHNQKLNMLLKGEYLATANGASMDAVYESGAILYSRAAHTGCVECADDLTPGEFNSPQGGFIGEEKEWRTDAAQIATNFFSTESPAPSRQINLSFKGKGSTVDWQAGTVGNITFGLATSDNPYFQEYIMVNNNPSLSRFKSVFGKLNSTDIFNIANSSTYNDGLMNHNTNGNYNAVDMIDGGTSFMVMVTGGAKLFPTLMLGQRPATITQGFGDFTGIHKIAWEGDYYIENAWETATDFETFYNEDTLGNHVNPPQGMVLPEFYSAEVDGGIKGGGNDILEVTIPTDPENVNNGSYTVLETYYTSPIDNITIERLKVKEKVVHQLDVSLCPVRRVNHLPRISLTYRSRHQYDRPGDT